MPLSLPIRILVCLSLLCLSAEAQFAGIAVDGAASNVWFSSNLRLKGDEGAPAAMLYQTGPAALSYFWIRRTRTWSSPCG
ncbi:hypothetical protein [Paludibaculum fermentans]|uniref:Uncharacterized protein n=1 Tax=Paludibaculum fermentans TaxID=1473598 RepID=A0A7S7NMU0_PALFE|nr:hypothetical protein [Paludibaculum fermentans]QOY86517.1 hypothetical protein IRI77_27500 [Paludibaculum fermentans]